ncbi:MAG TPA: GLPGLI family protein, partial [Dysgonamonadaceae bacterium]|nr:GLPGLI family protein [Dysgonamonadaceae bacterium]
KTLLDYSCQMAVCNFRGREWTAWFATYIPVSDGPWKFGGLPGLIMEAYDKGNQYVFTIVGLQKVEDEPIIFRESYLPAKRFEKTNRLDFLKANKASLMDLNGYFEMETGIDLSEGNPPKIMRYDLLELDYK